jgi:hypothetical protein
VSRSCAFWDVGYIQNTQERFVVQGFLRDTLPSEGCSPVTSEYEGFRPVACDLVGFFRPPLSGCVGKHDQSGADKALPAIVLAVVAAGGSVGKVRLPLLRLVLRADPSDCSAAALQRRALRRAGAALQAEAVLVVAAGFGVADLLTEDVPRFVARVARHFTARCNVLPAYKGRGRRPSYGTRVRPLPRTHKGKTMAATPPDATAQWVVAGRMVRAHVWNDLVLATAKPGAATFRGVVLHDPRFQEPLVVATNLPLSADALWCLYRDRWPIEQGPLAAKQRLGAHRAFVFGGESRHRLPELGLLAGNVLTYVAATPAAMATGFWDRRCRPTCGRWRRVLLRVDFSEVPVPEGSLRKKASVTAHLPKGVQGHRRRPGVLTLLANSLRRRKAA